MASFGTKVLKGAAIVGVFALLGKLLGIVQKLVIAKQFGTSMEADAFVLAFSSIVFTFFMIPQQMLSAFLPIFAERREKSGEPEAWRFAGTVGVITIVVMVVILAASLLWTPQLVAFVSSFRNPDAATLTTRLARIMLPAAFFMSLFYLASLILNSYKRFALPASGDTLNKALLIITLLALYHVAGIFALAAGVVVGAAAALLLQLFGIRSKLGMLRTNLNFHDPSLRRFAALLPPIAVSIAVAQARTILDYKFSSAMGEGLSASLNYARGLADSLTAIVPAAVGVAIYPYFADLMAEGQKEKLADALMRSMRMMAFLFIPFTVAFVVLHTPIVQLVYERGRFEAASVPLTAGPFMYYSFGLCFFAVEIILMRFYFSMKDTLTPAIVGILCVFLHVGVILLSRDVLQHQSMALAATLSKASKVAILFFLLAHKDIRLRIWENLAFVIKGLLAAAAMGLVVWLVNHYGAGMLHADPAAAGMTRTLVLAARLGIAVAAGFAVFAVAVILLRIEEAQEIWSLIRRKRPVASTGQSA